jgi:predicted nucleic acid-binding protein
MKLHAKRILGMALALSCALVAAQTPNPTQRLRGTVESFDGSTLVLKERSGEVLRLVLDEKFSVNEVFPIELPDVERAKTVVLGHPALSARDAVHIAIMERQGISRIMSFDSGFDTYPGLERLGR